jgi:hypothetical protein
MSRIAIGTYKMLLLASAALLVVCSCRRERQERTATDSSRLDSAVPFSEDTMVEDSSFIDEASITELKSTAHRRTSVLFQSSTFTVEDSNNTTLRHRTPHTAHRTTPPFFILSPLTTL